MAQSLTHFFEIRLIPQLEVDSNQVLSYTLQGLHRLLPQFEGRVGISFPTYSKYSLGGILRVFGSDIDCQTLLKKLHQNEVKNYILLSSVEKIPQERILGHLIFSRVHPKGKSHLRRAEKRLSAEGKWDKDVEKRMQEKWGIFLKLPYAKLDSSSTKQNFTLFIKQNEVEKEQLGEFNYYGLSSFATVPKF